MKHWRCYIIIVQNNYSKHQWRPLYTHDFIAWMRIIIGTMQHVDLASSYCSVLQLNAIAAVLHEVQLYWSPELDINQNVEKCVDYSSMCIIMCVAVLSWNCTTSTRKCYCWGFSNFWFIAIIIVDLFLEQGNNKSPWRFPASTVHLVYYRNEPMKCSSMLISLLFR